MTKEELIAYGNDYYKDLISACCEINKKHKEFVKMSLEALEQEPSSSEKPNKWIPVSERLPEDKTYVLTTICVPGRQPHSRSGWYQDEFFHNDNGDVWKATDMEVVAWMPLPEPYKEGE